ncbi:nitroreductase [Actinoplanes sp. L3-i22]|uniref:Acg family FMN-binding oxidoreductase n=1 Tax=Actinoplanes sp. L3-i22 TaxID=2836373 RepID=UPI001C75E449|nr:nitroreductase [Actinoplanes sp. L3-i22]BCY14065.1 NAD(P)H nitroreductase [Actinoplanes sp. L3-i22]
MNEVKQALAQAADAARFAPSIHNTQPWRWVVRADRLELYAVTGRQLHAQDPDARMLLVSCGAALHHAQVALDAEGWGYTVERPGSLDGPLAVITPGDRRPAEPEATRHLQMLQVRRTDRRTVRDEAVPGPVLDALVKAASPGGAELHLLDRDQVLDLAVAVEHAQSAEDADERARAELATWVGGDRPDGTGIPASALPAEVPLTTVAERDFQAEGSVTAGDGHDRAATYGVLYGRGDAPSDWLRSGESLSRLWLAATEHAVSLLPFSGPVEVPFTRAALTRLLGGTGVPYLAVRLGLQDPDRTAPPHTPRLPATQVITLAD